jgi:uncharacterized protein YkwD
MLGAMMMLNRPAAYAAEAPEIARTKAWDSIKNTLGGIPKRVAKIEYAGSVFYLGTDVTEANFLAVLEAGPKAVRMKPPVENGTLYNHPVYILWNSDKTVLLVHPIVFNSDEKIETVAIPTNPPASLLEEKPVSEPKTAAILTVEQEYMPSPEYAEAVRTEFYRLLNEHRKVNGKSELEINLELQGYADIRADEQRLRFGHTRPDGTPAGSGWHNSKNFINSRYAENALLGVYVSTTPEDAALSIFSSWKESEGHNRHMLYNFESHIQMAFGISQVQDEDGNITTGAIFATGY